ncbi:hypothetical protein M9Y10_028266 [Tritrichomonas musculus]|uniref:Serine/threonine-protein phosphatase n=1 Tax=Tritrichomonas musculus TaxID=1915356 RepID=A0ABR2KJM9_9EUKA
MQQSDFDVEKIIQKIKKSPPEIISSEDVIKVIEISKSLFVKEENLISISAPLVIVGDLHGQLYDLLEIFRVEPPPPESQFLFLGDYVDRGYYSVETLLFLLCLKIKFPNRVYLLRGNHECKTVSRSYGFYFECKYKYENQMVYDKFCELFDFLPLAALIEKRIFAVHGGLSPSFHLLDQVQVANRFTEPDVEGIIADLLWADPHERSGFLTSKRGVGYTFGADVTKKFAHLNNLIHITRAHQVSMKGYSVWFDGLLSTVWSAPNYMYRTGNLASIMRLSDSQRNYSMVFNVFDAVPKSERTVPETNSSILPYFL